MNKKFWIGVVVGIVLAVGLISIASGSSISEAAVTSILNNTVETSSNALTKIGILT